MNVRGKDGTWYTVPDHIMGDRDGRTFSPTLDKLALDTQAGLVFLYMSTHEWVTPGEVSEAIGWEDWDHGSVTARFRDFRKAKFGGYVVRRRRVAGKPRLHEYRLMDPEDEPCPASPSSPTSTAPAATTGPLPLSSTTSTSGWRIVRSSP